MTFEKLLETFINSDKEEWNTMGSWGHGSGPSYRDQFSFSEMYQGESYVLEHREHSNMASYMPNLSITIAWGIESGDKSDVVDRDWAKNNPNPNPGTSSYLDFFYNNALVFRVAYCLVDGGRCPIPFPDYDEHGNVSVPREHHDLIKKFSEISNRSFIFDGYFARTGITISEEEWK